MPKSLGFFQRIGCSGPFAIFRLLYCFWAPVTPGVMHCRQRLEVEGRDIKKRTKDFNWARVFIELSLRAIRRIHYEYGPWGVGRPWVMNKRRTRLINMGKAIELADERTVCAAITQEFINTSAVAGRWIDESNKEEERYFQIEREQDYSASLRNQKKSKVDIFLRKYIRNSKNGELAPVEKPSFIEAKRARIWTVKNFSTGEVKRARNNQARVVRDDIKKLRDEMNARSQNDAIHCHILVWGIYNHGNMPTGDHPFDFFDDVADGNVELHQIRWPPIEWKNPSHKEIFAREKHAPNITRSLWVALAQVFEEN